LRFGPAGIVSRGIESPHARTCCAGGEASREAGPERVLAAPAAVASNSAVPNSAAGICAARGSAWRIAETRAAARAAAAAA
jgi:hypothetical protein